MAAPSTNLLKIGHNVHWSEGCGRAFLHIKGFLANAPVLPAYNDEQPFLLQDDAGYLGAGAGPAG